MRMTRQAMRLWRGAGEIGSLNPALEIANRNAGADWGGDRFRTALQEQVRPARVEGGRPSSYDRPGSAHPAAADTPVRRSTSVPPAFGSVPPMLVRERVAALMAETPPPVEQRTATPPKPRAAVVIRPKPTMRSRTIWLNGLTVLAACGVILSDIVGLFSVRLTASEQIMMLVLLGVGVMNILLRFETRYPIGSPVIYRSPAKAALSSAARSPGAGKGEGTR